MGNQNLKKIIVLDDQQDGRQKNYQQTEEDKKQYQLLFYQSLQEFIQKQNPKLIQSIIVNYDHPPVTLVTNNSFIKQEQQTKKVVTFYDVCPSYGKKTKSLKDDVIKYIKRHSLNLTICLYVDDHTTIKLLEHQKPYIKFVSHDFQQIIRYLSQNRQSFASKNILIDNMFQGLYRRIMVKIIDQNYIEKVSNKNSEQIYRIIYQILDLDTTIEINPQNPQQIKDNVKLLRDQKLSYKYFKNIEKFEHSNVSTNCQYVICKDQLLIDLIDSKRICQEDYKILVLNKNVESILSLLDQDPNQKSKDMEKDKENDKDKEKDKENDKSKDKFKDKDKIKENENEKLKDVKIRKNQKLRKQIDTTGTFKQLVQRMKKTTNHFDGIMPKVARNTIICGDDEIFLKNKDKIHSQLKQEFKTTHKKIMNIEFVGKQQKEILNILKRDIYSFVVVFNEGKYLQDIKKLLRINNFSNRVQLTSIPDLDPKRKPEEVLKFKIQYLKQSVDYKIKFEVGPLFSIHIYQPTEQQLQFFGHKLGLITEQITNLRALRTKYMGPNYEKIIESQHLICDVHGYIEDIRPVLEDNNQNKQSQFQNNLKVIIMDSAKNLKYLFSRPDLYNEKVVLVDYDLQKIEQFLKYEKSYSVSTPFFRKGMLSQFQKVYKSINMIKNSINLSLKTIVVSENEILENIFGNQIRFHTTYNMQLLKYSSSNKKLSEQIIEFEKKYLSSYVRLWYMGYYIFDRNASSYSYFETIKDELCFSFYKCRSYDLLNINEQDFQQFYINQISSCTTLFDLQVACIYVLSMPHGFSEVISQIFKNPTRSKLAIKIFVTYMVILASAFYDYQIKQVGCIQLIVKIKEENIESTLNEIKSRDTIFTNDFIFCTQRDRGQKVQHYHTFIFNFENTHFQQKSRIKSYLNIENFSFYKEGAEYIIAPFVKFQVVSVQKNEKGKYQIKLNHISLGQSSFMHQLLTQNGIYQEMIMQNLNTVPNNKNLANDKIKKNKKKANQTFLYRRAQINSMAVTKRDTIKQFEKGIHYQKFFAAKNREKFLTAKMHLQAKIRQLKKQIKQSEGSNNNVKHELEMLGVDEAFINFKIGQYGESLKQLKQVQNYLEDENDSKGFNQLIELIKKYSQSVQMTLENRRKLIFNHPKRKFWKVTLNQSKLEQNKQPEFKLRSKTQSWQVKYQVIQQIFPMNYIETQKSDKKNIQKIIKSSPIYISFPTHEFGAFNYANFHAELFSYPTAGVIIKNLLSSKQIPSPEKNTRTSNILISHPILAKYHSQLEVMEKKEKEKEKENLQGERGEQIYKEQIEERNKNQVPFVKVHLKEGEMLRQREYEKFAGVSLIGDFPQQKWSVFYLNNELKIVPKKNHFHAKPKKKGKNKEIIYNRAIVNQKQQQKNGFILDAMT